MIERIADILKGKRKIGEKRSPLWRQVRRDHLDLNPVCEVCGGDRKLEVHHIEPFHIRPDLELNPVNLITLCESGKGGLVCHLAVGHLGNYRSWNRNVKTDTREWFKKIRERPGGRSPE